MRHIGQRDRVIATPGEKHDVTDRELDIDQVCPVTDLQSRIGEIHEVQRVLLNEEAVAIGSITDLERVEIVAPVNQVRSGTVVPDQRIVAGSPVEHIDSPLPVKGVVVGTAQQCVVTSAAKQVINPRTTGDVVIATTPAELIGSLAGQKRVVTRTTHQRIAVVEGNQWHGPPP